jgi:hypothetical protein
MSRLNDRILLASSSYHGFLARSNLGTQPGVPRGIFTLQDSTVCIQLNSLLGLVLRSSVRGVQKEMHGL